MRKILPILLLPLLVSCNQTLQVSEMLNNLQCTDKNQPLNIQLANTLQISDARTIVYSYNTQCSECVGQFIMLMKHIDDYRFDSLLIIAHEAYDFIQSDFIMQKSEVSLPNATRIIFDPNDNIYDSLIVAQGDANLLLVEAKCVLAKCNTQLFTFDESLGFCVDSRKVKKK